MSEPFGPHANRLFSLAAQALGWRPHEFWSATPAELAAALSRPTAPLAESLDRSELNRLMEQENG